MTDKTVNDLIEKSNNAAEGDYTGQDGLLYCGKCNTPKQTKVEISGAQRIVGCMCKCREAEVEAERIALLEKERRQHIKRLRQYGFADEKMQGWTFDKDDGVNDKITGMAQAYVSNFAQMKESGKGLLLFGPVGTGKTFTAACIANALIDQGHACLMTNFSRLVNILQGMYEGRQEYIDRLDDFELLVIDDLGSERGTEYMDEIVYSIIDSRYRAGLPLIITTNLTSEELKRPAEIRKQRVYSRLFEMCLPVLVDGVDRRKMSLINNYDNMAELLGLETKEEKSNV